MTCKADCDCENPPETPGSAKVTLGRNEHFNLVLRQLLFDYYGAQLPEDEDAFIRRINICTDGVTVTLDER